MDDADLIITTHPNCEQKNFHVFANDRSTKQADPESMVPQAPAAGLASLGY